MTNGVRDLLFVSKYSTLSDLEMEKEMQLLNQLLYGVESMSTSALVNEVIDLNRYKIIRKPWQVARAIRQKSNKAFVFIYNKN